MAEIELFGESFLWLEGVSYLDYASYSQLTSPIYLGIVLKKYQALTVRGDTDKI